MTGTEPQAWGTGLMDNITFVGLDVHKATVCIAVAEGVNGGGKPGHMPASEPASSGRCFLTVGIG